MYRLYTNIIALSGVPLFSDMYREEAGLYVKIMIFFFEGRAVSGDQTQGLPKWAELYSYSKLYCSSSKPLP